MVLFILDGSGYQPNADHHAIVKQGYAGLIAKSTQGATGRDSAFAHNKAGSKAANLRFAAYHFLTERPISDQATNCAGMINDRSIPVWIDLERTTGSHPTLKMATDFADAMVKRGYRVPGIYFPRFYWNELHSPTFPHGFLLWQAVYANNRSGHAADAYTHHMSSGWNKQGGVTPTLLQFSDLIKVDGFNSNTWDCSAFNGTYAQLDSLKAFRNWSGVVPPKPPKPHVIPAFPLTGGKVFGLQPHVHTHNGVRTWQAKMNSRGWPLKADGVFGAKSHGTAVAFQHEKHLKVDGLVGPHTWEMSWKAPVT
jgi:lysozyme